jgi:hypothetical protein
MFVFLMNVGLSLKAVLLRLKLATIATKSAYPSIADCNSGTASVPESRFGLAFGVVALVFALITLQRYNVVM